ncbi:FtsB family cell division protein [Desertibaculum subflavum]|uniref:FtsB family cell division protein n=1 Tax=Desertibaculum subflavum TaxID=2268458 RepID=UPI000E664380
MLIIHEIRRRLRGVIVPVLCAGMIGYFGYHMVEGDRGLKAYARLSAEIGRAETAYASVSEERLKLERRVKLLRSTSLDLDMLDEQSRRVLDLIGPDEVVIVDRR